MSEEFKMPDLVSVTEDLSVVQYGNRLYHVLNLIKLPSITISNDISHECIDGFVKTIKLEYIIYLERGPIRAGFCNKCKTLVVK